MVRKFISYDYFYRHSTFETTFEHALWHYYALTWRKETFELLCKVQFLSSLDCSLKFKLYFDIKSTTSWNLDHFMFLPWILAPQILSYVPDFRPRDRILSSLVAKIRELISMNPLLDGANEMSRHKSLLLLVCNK